MVRRPSPYLRRPHRSSEVPAGSRPRHRRGIGGGRAGYPVLAPPSPGPAAPAESPWMLYAVPGLLLVGVVAAVAYVLEQPRHGFVRSELGHVDQHGPRTRPRRPRAPTPTRRRDVSRTPRASRTRSMSGAGGILPTDPSFTRTDRHGRGGQRPHELSVRGERSLGIRPLRVRRHRRWWSSTPTAR